MAFEGGYRMRHDPAFLFNIAQCQRQLRRYEERSYRAYLRETADLSDSTRAQVQKLAVEAARSSSVRSCSLESPAYCQQSVSPMKRPADG